MTTGTFGAGRVTQYVVPLIGSRLFAQTTIFLQRHPTLLRIVDPECQVGRHEDELTELIDRRLSVRAVFQDKRHDRQEETVVGLEFPSYRGQLDERHIDCAQALVIEGELSESGRELILRLSRNENFHDTSR